MATIDPVPSTAVMQQRWLSASPEVFSARWYGFLSVSAGGTYTFSLRSDDGAVLAIDGTTVVDNGGRHGLEARSNSVDLAPGAHTIALTYNQFGGALALDVDWARAGDPLEPLTAEALTPGKPDVSSLRIWRAADIAASSLLLVAALLLPVLAWLRRDLLVAWPRASSLALFVLLALVHTWPLVTDIAHLTRHDNRDTILNEWIIGWVAHQLPRNPLHLYDGNAFHPERFTLAYSEPMVVQAVLALPLIALGASLTLVYNLLLVAGMALSGWAMALVIKRWTGSWTAGLVAGAIYAFNAHSLSRIPHLQAQHVEFLPWALLAFDRLLEAPVARNALRLAGWFVLQSLTSVYLLVFSAFALMAAAVARVTDLRRHPLFTLQALLIAAVASVAVLTPFLLPYLWVSRELGVVRSLDDAAQFSTTWEAYLTTPARIHQWWSARFAGGNVLFPGALGLALSVLALASGTAFRDPRARMAVIIGATGAALSFGPSMPGYATLYSLMPLLQGVRATARFGWLVIVAVSILSGFGVAELQRRLPGRRPVLQVLLVLVAALESVAAPLGLTRFEGIPPIYATIPRGAVVLEMPFYGSRSVQFNAHYMLNSTLNWQPLVNGYSGFQPPSYYRNAVALERFPDDASLAHIRSLGVTHIFVREDQVSEAVLAALRTRTDLTRVDTFGAIALYTVQR